MYTRAFFRHVSTLDVYNIRFLDESSFHLNTCLRHYGSARRGERATEISKHYMSPNYTLFYLSGFMDKHYCKVATGPSTTADFIDFIHEACEARTVTGAPVISPECTIFSDNYKIHVGWADTILIPYLADKNIEHHWIPKYSPYLNPLEMAFSIAK